MPYLLLLLVYFALLGAVGCASTGESETEPMALQSIKKSAFKAKIIWTRNISGQKKNHLKLSPYITQDRLFAASGKGYVTAFNLKDGKKLWQKNFNLPISSPIGGNRDWLIFGTRDAEVLLVDQAHGDEKWRLLLSSEILAKPIISGKLAIVRTADGKLFGINIDTGKSVWSYARKVPALSLHGTGSPVAQGKTVYAGFDNGKLVAFTLQDGKVIWEVTLGVPTGRSELERMVDLDADPILADNVLFAVSFQGRIAAIERENGRKLWDRELSSYSGLTLGPHNVYISDSNGRVWALDRETGATFWKQEKLLARNLSAPAMHGKYIVVGDFEGFLHWMSREDGRLVGRTRIDNSSVLVTPMIVNGIVYAQSQNGVLAAVATPSSVKTQRDD